MKIVRVLFLTCALVGALFLVGCAGQGVGSTPVPITVAPGEQTTAYDASQAIRSYASRVLGLNVTVKSASGRKGTIILPAEAQQSVNAAIKLAGVTYWGLLDGGLASVSLGDGEISGDLTADIESASLGVFVMTRQGALPASEAEALAQIGRTFPGIAGLDYVARPRKGKGYTFQATTTVRSLDPSGKVVAVAQSVVVSVTPALRRGRVLVWVVMANGTLTKALTF